MRVRIDPPSSGPVGTVSILDGDEYGLGNVCYVGPWAYILEDQREDVEHQFCTDMQAVIRHHMRSKHFRTAVFCSYDQFERKQRWAEYWYDTTPQSRISSFISGLSPTMKFVFEFCIVFTFFAILTTIAMLIERYVS